MRIENQENGNYVLHLEPCVKNSLDTLYKKTSTGAIQQWSISVVQESSSKFPVIAIIWGQLDGRKQLTTEEVTEGKNIGKANETTPFEQAMSQMQSEWEKRLKKGYVKTIEEAQEGATDTLISGGIFPMLAHVFDKQEAKIKYPALVQPKLDGHRCIAQYAQDDITCSFSLWSRTRKPINSVPHINQALRQLFRHMQYDYPYVDGELYNHDYRENFEDLTSLIRQDEPKAGHEVVQYHIYDLPLDGKSNAVRQNWLDVLKSTIDELHLTCLKIVEARVVHNKEELMQAYEDFMEQGYEGAIVRNMDGMYKYKRSYDLQKVKQFNDDEFEIVDVKVQTKGKMKGLAVFICETKEGNRFDAKMKGKLDDLKQYADDPSLAIGRKVTVQFQGYTKKNNVPRFPVALRFREDI